MKKNRQRKKYFFIFQKEDLQTSRSNIWKERTQINKKKKGKKKKEKKIVNPNERQLTAAPEIYRWTVPINIDNYTANSLRKKPRDLCYPRIS